MNKQVCNRQIRTSNLLVKEEAMTRSTVQKAVVVLTSKPSFGLRLPYVTGVGIEELVDRERTVYGRELVHMFCQRTLVSLKTLMLQKKIMFHGHPQVEKLCTYQYSLVTLIPGLLQDLDDCGSPPLATCAKGLECPTELKTSDSKSMMRLAYLWTYLGSEYTRLLQTEDDVDRCRAGLKIKSSSSLRSTSRVHSRLSSIPTFWAEEQGNGVVIADGAGNPNAVQDFNMLWISEFEKTKAYEVWDRVTDPLLFDIVEPRHPCIDKPPVAADIGI
ncbi:transport protein Avl9-domain-containing protein [Irpex rosettiformis]|uniref:Transport protein Avl9-domain-containing protein n=1 Tax=Irpex rosettiformis TaxID=378272 RepID=A0ACB8TMX1_9APHY|nr:transport protein Avl9-domain-containing protein [Irpex rosettiformis]